VPGRPSNDAPYRLIRDCELGDRVVVYSFTNLYECSIGTESRIGTFVEIQRGVRIGSRCKVGSHTFICEGVRIGDEVFLGHGVTFVNDKHPRSTGPDGSLQGPGDWRLVETAVERGASVGSGALILSGVTIGSDAFVGAGSVVTRDVAAGTTVAGNPARERTAAKAPTRAGGDSHP
jgi:UDP-2-acetamido-3-amino-2,3-dideoxy-glucuronate N-acetyltransferase